MVECTPQEKARIVMLNGLNWSYDEIANEVGVSKTTVGKYLNEFEDESKAVEDWRGVFWQAVLPDVFDSSFVANIANAFK